MGALELGAQVGLALLARHGRQFAILRLLLGQQIVDALPLGRNVAVDVGDLPVALLAQLLDVGLVLVDHRLGGVGQLVLGSFALDVAQPFLGRHRLQVGIFLLMKLLQGLIPLDRRLGPLLGAGVGILGDQVGDLARIGGAGVFLEEGRLGLLQLLVHLRIVAEGRDVVGDVEHGVGDAQTGDLHRLGQHLAHDLQRFTAQRAGAAAFGQCAVELAPQPPQPPDGSLPCDRRTRPESPS